MPFNEAENTTELLSCVKNLMPLPDTDYNIVNVKGTTTKFKASVKCSVKNADYLNKLITNYNLKNNETLKVSKTRIVTDQNSPYQMIKYFQCHHNTRYEPTMNPKESWVINPRNDSRTLIVSFHLLLDFPKQMKNVVHCWTLSGIIITPLIPFMPWASRKYLLLSLKSSKMCFPVDYSLEQHIKNSWES